MDWPKLLLLAFVVSFTAGKVACILLFFNEFN